MTMTGTPQGFAVPPGDLPLLMYAQHMANTARSEAARRMFVLFLELERRRLTRRVDGAGPEWRNRAARPGRC
jgi:hypothetical protein